MIQLILIAIAVAVGVVFAGAIVRLVLNAVALGALAVVVLFWVGLTALLLAVVVGLVVLAVQAGSAAMLAGLVVPTEAAAIIAAVLIVLFGLWRGALSIVRLARQAVQRAPQGDTAALLLVGAPVIYLLVSFLLLVAAHVQRSFPAICGMNAFGALLSVLLVAAFCNGLRVLGGRLFALLAAWGTAQRARLSARTGPAK